MPAGRESECAPRASRGTRPAKANERALWRSLRWTASTFDDSVESALSGRQFEVQ